jgi:hypothetical protein
LIFAVALPPVILMVALADELARPALVSITTDALPSTDALATDLDDPKESSLLFSPVYKTNEN